jgi:hypoxanthine-DNA glycosylase
MEWKVGFDPVIDGNSKVLILGSFPSVKSREQGFYYGNKQNRFWKMLGNALDKPVPESVEERKNFLLENKIALWDVIYSCDIVGSSDSSIKNVVPNDVLSIINASKIERIYVNGMTAKKYYDKFLKDKLQMEAELLPSTSPANAVFALDDLTKLWKERLFRGNL